MLSGERQFGAWASRPDAADLAAERQPCAGDRVLWLGLRAALEQLKVK